MTIDMALSSLPIPQLQLVDDENMPAADTEFYVKHLSEMLLEDHELGELMSDGNKRLKDIPQLKRSLKKSVKLNKW